MITREVSTIPRMWGDEVNKDALTASTLLLPVPINSGNVTAGANKISFPIALPPAVDGAGLLAARGLLLTGGAGTKKIHTVLDIKKAAVSVFPDKAIPTVLVYDDNGSPQFTDAAAEAWSAAGTPFTVLGAAADKLYLGFDYKAGCVYFDINAAAVITSVGWKYSKAAWGTLTVGNGTNGTAPFDQDGYVSWVPPSDWVPAEVNGVTKYWVELAVASGWTSGPTVYSIRDKSNLINISKGSDDEQQDAGIIETPVELAAGDILNVDILNVPETTPPTNLTAMLALQLLRPRIP